MGNCLSSGLTPEERSALKAETSASQQLDKDLQGKNGKESKVYKLLLLGTGESGKSTIFKQMQIIYDSEHGFTAIEKSTFKHVIRTNVVECLQALLSGIETFEIPYEDQKSQEFVDTINSLDAHSSDFWVPEIVDCVKALWGNEPAVAKMYEQRSKIQLLDSTEYLFENIEKIAADDYLPDKDDILRARLRTSGIHERIFHIHDVDFKFVDVGGQRNERKKWMHCFDGVTSVIFVAAVSEYDQGLFENHHQNRLIESINQFHEVSTLPYFAETAFILFLNKIDLFMKKVPKVSMRDTCFPDYDGDPTCVDGCLDYITSQFLRARVPDGEDPKKYADDCNVYPHTTCATDTDHIEQVFEACKLIILRNNLEALGML